MLNQITFALLAIATQYVKAKNETSVDEEEEVDWNTQYLIILGFILTGILCNNYVMKKDDVVHE